VIRVSALKASRRLRKAIRSARGLLYELDARHGTRAEEVRKERAQQYRRDFAMRIFNYSGGQCWPLAPSNSKEAWDEYYRRQASGRFEKETT
jgi:hypothetical protein